MFPELAISLKRMHGCCVDRYLIGKGSMIAKSENAGLDLPSIYRAVALREHRDAFAHAQAIAADEGAGTLVWVRRFDTIEIALVLEPEQKLAEARCVIFAAMSAAADALALHCPPEKPLAFAWPDTIMLDGGIIGGCRLGVAPNCGQDDVPDWLVLGLNLRSVVETTVDHSFTKGTSLSSEGFEMMDGGKIIESFARHLMAALDGWRAVGYKLVADTYLARLQPAPGVRRGLDANGDLLLRRLSAINSVERSSLTAALATPQWLDPATNEPWI
jgi:biotin-(acetyl-CoA carboxylase) ligase